MDKKLFIVYLLKCLIFHHTHGGHPLRVGEENAQGFGNQYWKTCRIKQQKANKREWERRPERRETEKILKTHLSAQMQINWCCFLKSMETSARNTASFGLNFKVSQVNFLLMRNSKNWNPFLSPLFYEIIVKINTCFNCIDILIITIFVFFFFNFKKVIVFVFLKGYFHNKFIILDLSGG